MLTVETSVHGLPSVQMRNATTDQMHAVRMAVGANRIGDPVYHLAKDAGVFLQGYDEHDGWVLVEFWTRDEGRYQPFVDHLNTVLFGEDADHG